MGSASPPSIGDPENTFCVVGHHPATCTATLRVNHPSTGVFCAGSCGSGQSVLSLAALDNDPASPVFEVTDVVCNPSFDSDHTEDLEKVVAARAAVT